MTSTIRFALSTAALGALALGSLTAQTTTITILPDKDTTLYEDTSGNLANGGGQSVFVGRVGLQGGYTIRRALLHFDIAGNLPAGARVLACELELFSAQSSAFLPIQTFVHRVQQDWSEGSVVAPGQGGSGGIAAAGESTWLHRDFPTQLWNTPGGDFDATPSFVFDLPGIGAVKIPALPGLVADVQDMLDAPAANFGWLLKTDEVQNTNARRIPSREAFSMQPALTITYLPQGATAPYGTGSVVGTANFTLDVSGTPSGGATLPIVYSNAPASSVGATFYSLWLDPIGVTLQPSTTVYLPTAGLVPGAVFLTSNTGDAAAALNVPTGFPGFLITMQAAAIDNSPLGLALSNAGAVVIQ